MQECENKINSTQEQILTFQKDTMKSEKELKEKYLHIVPVKQALHLEKNNSELIVKLGDVIADKETKVDIDLQRLRSSRSRIDGEISKVKTTLETEKKIFKDCCISIYDKKKLCKQLEIKVKTQQEKLKNIKERKNLSTQVNEQMLMLGNEIETRQNDILLNNKILAEELKQTRSLEEVIENIAKEYSCNVGNINNLIEELSKTNCKICPKIVKLRNCSESELVSKVEQFLADSKLSQTKVKQYSTEEVLSTIKEFRTLIAVDAKNKNNLSKQNKEKLDDYEKLLKAEVKALREELKSLNSENLSLNKQVELEATE